MLAPFPAPTVSVSLSVCWWFCCETYEHVICSIRSFFFVFVLCACLFNTAAFATHHACVALCWWAQRIGKFSVMRRHHIFFTNATHLIWRPRSAFLSVRWTRAYCLRAYIMYYGGCLRSIVYSVWRRAMHARIHIENRKRAVGYTCIYRMQLMMPPYVGRARVIIGAAFRAWSLASFAIHKKWKMNMSNVRFKIRFATVNKYDYLSYISLILGTEKYKKNP